MAARLYDATVEGRLRADELDQRLGVALAARTYGELEPLVSDLPGPRAIGPQERPTWTYVLVALVLTLLLAAVGVVAWHRS